MMGWLIWGIYLGIGATIAFSIFQWFMERRERKLYRTQREQNIEEEQAWIAAHGAPPGRKPQVPALGEQPEQAPAAAEGPRPKAKAAPKKAARTTRSKPGTSTSGKTKTAKPAASRPARPRAARPPREP